MIIHILLFSLLISLFTCGLSIILEYDPTEQDSKQMLGYGIRKYFYKKRKAIEDRMNDDKERISQYYLRDTFDKFVYEHSIKELENLYNKELSYEKYFKPIFLCVYCMPSFWGTILWVSYFGFNHPIYWLTSIVCSVFINALIWNLFRRYDN